MLILHIIFKDVNRVIFKKFRITKTRIANRTEFCYTSHCDTPKERMNVMVSFDESRCKGCGLCVGACPKGIVAISKETMNQKGFHPARVTDDTLCINCGFCAEMCPDVVIRVEK